VTLESSQTLLLFQLKICPPALVLGCCIWLRHGNKPANRLQAFVV
jgi:hypothetical protein